ncbi:phage minor head protein [Riemerella anatipestifer]|uniref:phage minor head protein n=1 Tax=Riemerella anatipestifer TaxID=34085 RepID=UPI000FDE6A3F|nr:phage minor head protein [Riemerella anatipestifer]MBT0573739.1 minor capsid protein [Riemerella anatipestifer]QZO86370.1 minor capsid protein [Riemerella anatipestifer]QZO95074.1 minor capsid protein [Riemerella anatipestifer]WRU42112.1 phage minor head protein [Riemerella anatipestifer]
MAKITEYKGLINKTAELFSSQIPQETPEEMRAYLEQDAFIFSGLKTHTQLAEARSYLKDEKGDLRPYHDFEQKVLKLNKQYNQHYLEAEYEFAAHSSMSAANWANLQEDTGRYWLEYRTAGDERVRASHQQLNGICLPKTDAFWTEYYPPNGWRCRCVAVEVLAREKTLSDSKKAQELGQYATSQIGKSGKNKLAMFRFNPGQQKKMFPPNNTYNKVVGADKVKKQTEKLFSGQDYKILNKNTDFIHELKKAKNNEKITEPYPLMDIEKKTSVRMYSDHYYKQINQFNRGLKINFDESEGVTKAYFKAITRTINKALDEIPDRFRGRVFRGANLEQKDVEVYKKAFETGELHIEKSFMSTSYDDKGKFNGNVYFEIETKDAAIIEKLSKFSYEKEVLFKAGQKFKVFDFIDKGEGNYLIKMKQI